MVATGSVAIVLWLCRVMPDFYTTWIVLGFSSLLLRRRRPALCFVQVIAMVVAMIWRLDFGERANSFAGPWFAEEGAVFGMLASLLLLGVSLFISRYKVTPT